MTAATDSTATGRLHRGRSRLLWAGLALLVLGLLAAGARLQLGPAPEPSAAVSAEPPPLLLPASALQDPDIASAAELQAAGDHEAAASRFASVLADAPADANAQVGLALARWPENVQQSLRLLTDASSIDPDDAWPWLNLGVGQAIAFGLDRAEPSLRRARTAGRRTPAGWEAARRADDILHPDLAPGYPPLLLEPAEWQHQGGASHVRTILKRLTQDDRVGAAAAAQRLPGGQNTAEAIATAKVLGAYDKDRHTIAVSSLRALVQRHGDDGVAGFHLGILLAWQGDIGSARGFLRDAADANPRSSRGVAATQLLSRLSIR